MTEEVFQKQESVLETKDFLWSKKFSTNNDFAKVVAFFTLKIQGGFTLQKLSTQIS